MMHWRGKTLSYGPIPILKLLDRSAAFSSSSKLFVGDLLGVLSYIAIYLPTEKYKFKQMLGLSYDTNEIALKDAFSQHGDVIEVKVICHPVTGESKGYGFVKFSSENEAATALQKMAGEVLDGRNIRVHYANSG